MTLSIHITAGNGVLSSLSPDDRKGLRAPHPSASTKAVVGECACALAAGVALVLADAQEFSTEALHMVGAALTGSMAGGSPLRVILTFDQETTVRVVNETVRVIGVPAELVLGTRPNVKEEAEDA